MKRRDFLRTVGVVGGGVAATAGTARADEPGRARAGADPLGVLVDTTRCVGCRMCEFNCARVNGLPKADLLREDSPVVQPSETRWTVVQRHEVEGRSITVKRQCMHCLQPACASACLTKAMYQTPDGPVAWRAGKCMGCRYCMVSCPFDVPKFEYHSAVPSIQKCQFCLERVSAGEQPACVAACPAGALAFGRRGNLLEEARHRIYTERGRYVTHIYGEHEAGGTSWLYLSAVPFERIGFRTDLANEGYPTFAREFLYAVPQVDILAPLFLLGLARAAASRDADEGGEE